MHNTFESSKKTSVKVLHVPRNVFVSLSCLEGGK